MTLIFHASDLHFGAEDPAALDWFVEEVKLTKPDGIVITGDLTMRARHDEFRDACHWLQALPAPVSVEVGNHDLPYFNVFARFLRPYRRYAALEKLIEKPLVLPGIAVVPLRTTARAQWRLDWSKGVVTGDRLEETLGAISAVDAMHKLVACHHPLIEGGTQSSGSTRGGQAALHALAAAGATAVLSGHVHDPFDIKTVIRGQTVRLIGAGTLSERVRASRPSYNAITLDAQDMDVTAVRMA